jgi:hypothetical protein
MAGELVDRYLLGEPVSKPEVVAALLADRSPAAAAEPFYRALEAVGTRAADEAFVALRLVLAGRLADDGAVRRLRGLAAVARATAVGNAAGVRSALARDREWLADLAEGAADEAGLGASARAAYFAELAR